MAFKIFKETIIKHESAIDLLEIPFPEWPEEAQNLARQVLQTPAFRKEFMSQLPGMKESYLVKKIEQLQALNAEFLDD